MSIIKKHIRLTDDLSATEPTVKMVCDCGWEEKAFTQDALLRAVHHLRRKHDGGVLHYKKWTREVHKDGAIKPVIHNAHPKYHEPRFAQ